MTGSTPTKIILKDKNMAKIGRPSTKEKKLKDGWYFKVCNKGASAGIRIWSQTEEDMRRSIKRYEKTKDIIMMGESVNGKFIKKKKEKKTK